MAIFNSYVKLPEGMISGVGSTNINNPVPWERTAMPSHPVNLVSLRCTWIMIEHLPAEHGNLTMEYTYIYMSIPGLVTNQTKNNCDIHIYNITLYIYIHIHILYININININIYLSIYIYIICKKCKNILCIFF